MKITTPFSSVTVTSSEGLFVEQAEGAISRVVQNYTWLRTDSFCGLYVS